MYIMLTNGNKRKGPSDPYPRSTPLADAVRRPNLKN
jgi:hypothetical protein